MSDPKRLLAHHGGSRGLFRLDVAELARVRGLGDAKAVRLQAALELGRRLAVLLPEERPTVGSPEDVANLLQIEMAALEQEQLRVVLLDTKHRILGTRTVYQGAAHIRTWATSRSTTMAPSGWMNRGTAIRDDRTLRCGSSARRG